MCSFALQCQTSANGIVTASHKRQVMFSVPWVNIDYQRRYPGAIFHKHMLGILGARMAFQCSEKSGMWMYVMSGEHHSRHNHG